jgi:uncharacterized protein YbaP (TraB family)
VSAAPRSPLRYPGPVMHAPLRLALTLLLLLGSACARRAPGQGVGYITPLAWEAIAPKSGSPVYLLGSIHVGSSDMGRLHPAITNAYARANELVVEVDLKADAAKMSAAYAARAYLPAGEQLTDQIAPTTWQQLEAYLGERGVDPEPFLGMKPWAVMLRLAGMQFTKEGYQAEYGIDQVFLRAAGDKPIVALESYELQLDLYDGFPFDVQEMMLLDFLDPEDPYQTNALIDAWRFGDEQAFVDLLFPRAERWQPYQERFFFERNEAMAAQLSELCRDGRSRFVVVGVGHMVGPRGIPALLADRGFRVRRIGVATAAP